MDQGELNQAYKPRSEGIKAIVARPFLRPRPAAGEGIPQEGRVTRRPGDRRWSSVHDYTGAASRPLTTPRGQSIDRALLPADERTRL